MIVIPQTLFGFITLPFDEVDSRLHNPWQRMFLEENAENLSYSDGDAESTVRHIKRFRESLLRLRLAAPVLRQMAPPDLSAPHCENQTEPY